MVYPYDYLQIIAASLTFHADPRRPPSQDPHPSLGLNLQSKTRTILSLAWNQRLNADTGQEEWNFGMRLFLNWRSYHKCRRRKLKRKQQKTSCKRLRNKAFLPQNCELLKAPYIDALLSLERNNRFLFQSFSFPCRFGIFWLTDIFVLAAVYFISGLKLKITLKLDFCGSTFSSWLFV